MRQEGGDWEEYKSISKVEISATGMGFRNNTRAFEKVAKDEDGRWNIVQGIYVEEQRFLAAYHRASWRTRSSVVSVPKLQQFSPGGPHVVGFSWKEAQQLVVRDLWRKFEWRAPNRLLVVHTGASRAKMLKAHAVPQGQCENLINALILLANQQEDGDGLLQNIVKNVGKESRKGLCERPA